jgi:2-polyprenyl-3-methyl-5-hydroxy-6-metoxy-1,4-benzoquinol methylase
MPITKNRRHVIDGYNATAKEYAAHAGEFAETGENARVHFLRLMAHRDSVLDIGCGAGWEARWFLRHGVRRVLGVDPASNLVAAARQEGEGEFRVGTIEDVTAADGLFDGIWCNRVFPHLHPEERGSFLQACADRLRPGGLLYLSVRLAELEQAPPALIHYIPRFDVSTAELMDLMRAAGLKLLTRRAWAKEPPWEEFVLQLPLQL